MSRYTIRPIIGGKKYTVAYGFDRPLQEYFIQVYDPDKETEDDEGMIVWEGSRMTNKANSEMLELFQMWKVPQEHCTQLALDLPF